MSAISVKGLHKSYGDKVVLDGIDLEVPEGTVFSLLSPNGAGKIAWLRCYGAEAITKARCST